MWRSSSRLSGSEWDPSTGKDLITDCAVEIKIPTGPDPKKGREGDIHSQSGECKYLSETTWVS